MISRLEYAKKMVKTYCFGILFTLAEKNTLFSYKFNRVAPGLAWQGAKLHDGGLIKVMSWQTDEEHKISEHKAHRKIFGCIYKHFKIWELLLKKFWKIWIFMEENLRNFGLYKEN